MKERGRWIPGYEGIYRVSNFGRVRRVARTVINSLGRVSKLPGKLMALTPDKLGYPRVSLYKNGSREHYLVHRLVAQAFVPNPEGLPHVLHKDDNPSNCRDSNLIWGTHQDNMKDMVRKGRHAHGSRHGRSKLTEKDIPKIRKLLAKGWTARALAERYNVTPVLIHYIKTGHSWSHV